MNNLYNIKWSEMEPQNTTEVDVQTKKVLITTNPPMGFMNNDEEVIHTHDIIAEIPVNLKDFYGQLHVRVLGIPKAKPLTKSYTMVLNIQSITSILELN